MKQRHVIRKLLISNSNLLNIIHAITDVYDISLDDETDQTIRSVGEITYNETINQRHNGVHNGMAEMIDTRDAETECHLIGLVTWHLCMCNI